MNSSELLGLKHTQAYQLCLYNHGKYNFYASILKESKFNHFDRSREVINIIHIR